MASKTFHRYFPTKGYALYWILFVYLVVGFFYPIIGLLALVCMVAPVAFAVKKGRWWCGNACPRGKDRKSTRLNSSHANISYAVFCLKKKKKTRINYS